MSKFYLVEIFDKAMTFKSSVQVDSSETIDLDYLTFNAFSINTLPLVAEKGDFVHVTCEGSTIADGIVADIQPQDGMVSLSIRPLQAVFDVDVFYSPVSDAIQWLADNIDATLIHNSDTFQNRPIVLTYALSGTNPLTGYNFNSTINILSVITHALKSYGIVTECSLDLINKTILCDIKKSSASDVLEANLDNVLEKEITLGDSYGAPNKLIVQKIQSVDGTKTVLDTRTYYLHPNGTINRSNSNRITPVFYQLEQIEFSTNMTDAEWNAAADAKATEVLTPTKYDNEILLSYLNSDRIANPMDMEIGTVVTVHYDGVPYESMLTGRRITGNVVTLCFGVVRSELTKKLMVGRANQQQGIVTQIMNEVSPQLNELYSLVEGGGEYLPLTGGNITGSLTVQNSAVITESTLSLDGKTAGNMTLNSPALRFGLKSNSNPTTYPRVVLRSAGAVAQGTLDLSLVYEQSSNSQQFFSLLSEDGEFLEGIVKIKSIQRISVSTSTSVAAGGNGTLTGTLNTSSGATNWFFVPVYVNYGYVRANITLSGTTVSVPVFNASGAAHTMAGNILCIGY